LISNYRPVKSQQSSEVTCAVALLIHALRGVTFYYLTFAEQVFRRIGE